MLKRSQSQYTIPYKKSAYRRSIAEWLERLTVNAKVATVLVGFDPSILRHSENLATYEAMLFKVL